MINFGLGVFDSFLQGDKDFFFLFVATEVDVDELVFFDKFFGGLDILFFHFRDVDFGIFYEEIFEYNFLLSFFVFFMLEFVDGVIGVDDDELEFFNTVFGDEDLFFDG